MPNTSKKKIFCPIPLPPPFYGSNIVNKDIIYSQIINDTFELDVMSISYNKKTENVGRIEIIKVFLTLKFFFLICKKAFEKFDLVYYVPAVTGYAFFRDLFLLLPLKLTRKNILIHLHGKGIKTNTDKSWFYKSLYKYFFKNTSVICLSKKLTYDIRDVHNGPIYVVNNGIKPVLNQLKKTNKTPVILFLSNLIESKGVLILLEAANILKQQQYDFKLNLVGAPFGDTMNNINSLISKYGLKSRILSIGPKYNDEKNEAFQNADIFVLPTFNDCFPLVLLEAMSFSLPVVSTDEGAIIDMVKDGETGYIAIKKNPVDLALKIALLLNSEHLRDEMGNRGKEIFLKHFTMNNFEVNIVKTFNDVLKTK